MYAIKVFLFGKNPKYDLIMAQYYATRALRYWTKCPDGTLCFKMENSDSYVILGNGEIQFEEMDLNEEEFHDK